MPYILNIRTIAIVNTAVNGMNLMIRYVQNVGEIHKLTDLAEIKNNFESKCSIKIETNSRGHNTTVHVYQGVTIAEIDNQRNSIKS
jgi:hypothetical protein